MIRYSTDMAYLYVFSDKNGYGSSYNGQRKKNQIIEVYPIEWTKKKKGMVTKKNTNK